MIFWTQNSNTIKMLCWKKFQKVRKKNLIEFYHFFTDFSKISHRKLKCSTLLWPMRRELYNNYENNRLNSVSWKLAELWIIENLVFTNFQKIFKIHYLSQLLTDFNADWLSERGLQIPLRCCVGKNFQSVRKNFNRVSSLFHWFLKNRA